MAVYFEVYKHTHALFRPKAAFREAGKYKERTLQVELKADGVVACLTNKQSNAVEQLSLLCIRKIPGLNNRLEARNSSRFFVLTLSPHENTS